MCNDETMHKLTQIFLWFSVTTLTLLVTLVFFVLSTYNGSDNPQVAGDSTVNTQTVVIAAPNENILIPILPPLESSFIASDARPLILSKFFETHSCPLEPYDHFAEKYIEAADKNNLDFRLIPAISMQESNCCKKMPDGSNNCWGFGIYGDKVLSFPSIEEGIDTVAKTLAKHYSSKGLLEPDEIMQKYTPQSKGTWAAGVLHFMNEMK